MVDFNNTTTVVLELRGARVVIIEHGPVKSSVRHCLCNVLLAIRFNSFVKQLKGRRSKK